MRCIQLIWLKSEVFVSIMCRSADAEMMLGQAWRTIKQCLGHIHPKLAAILVDLAAVKSQQGRLSEAQQLLARGIAMWRHMGAGSIPALPTALDALANLRHSQGERHAFVYFQKHIMMRITTHSASALGMCRHALVDSLSDSNDDNCSISQRQL